MILSGIIGFLIGSLVSTGMYSLFIMANEEDEDE